MRTAFEMADFILGREIGPDTKFTSVAKAREKRRRYLADLFRPIEQELRSNPGPVPGEGDEVLYAITSRGIGVVMSRSQANTDSKDVDVALWSASNAIRDLDIPVPPYSHDVNVAAAFTANRCIITHMCKTVKVPTRTIPYDDIAKAEPFAGKYSKLNMQMGGMTLVMAADGSGVVFLTLPMSAKDRDLYREFVPEQACEAVNELIMRYKQAGHAPQYQAAAPQAAPQPAPAPQAPQAAPAAPWAGAVPQAPQAPQAAAPAAGGLQPETVEALKQLKDLLDAGILTQEEFDGKKKQLLGL